MANIKDVAERAGVPNVSYPFFAKLTRYIEYYINHNGYKLLLCNSNYDSKKEQDYIDILKRNQVDGIIKESHMLDILQYQNLRIPMLLI